MQIDGSLDIKIIQGDSYRREITVEGISIDLIEGVYFSSAELGVCKKCFKSDNMFILEFNGEETKNYKCVNTSYDLTIKLSGNNVKTICYNASLIILKKENMVTCYE